MQFNRDELIVASRGGRFPPRARAGPELGAGIPPPPRRKRRRVGERLRGLVRALVVREREREREREPAPELRRLTRR